MQHVNTLTGITRAVLGEELPLSTPFLVQIFPVYGCNFRCEYCLHALPRMQHGYISDVTFMEIDLYKKCIDDMIPLPNKLKMLRFAGIGEPLLHKNISEMVRYAKLQKIAESVDIVTNGVLLNEKLSWSLIESGLDRLRISIQGVTAEKYNGISKANIDLNKFLQNLRFFYKHKEKTTVYIKIIDCALDDEAETKRFYDMFGELCDIIAVEHLAPAVQDIDYRNIAGGKSLDFTQNGNPVLDVAICPQPFYMLQINPDGAIVPCCSMKYPGVFGNISNQSIEEIWNSQQLADFRRNMLEGTQNAGPVCSECLMYKYNLFPEDVLDPFAQRLKAYY
ncbi:radical SAM/SPASM domain-containing protein [Desulfosporosinus shakirovi]|uniref:radical SAM/SPASM domain-containing protein n=1 Tax=Desulfosporosinus shakirovi TaxID=2885154 RepID=UPI001E307FE1|nr:radical SAM protein [Desulfosporosinus sp. SRJS8]MCB8814154.1 radical SAM protein [Desulfosporosinus sp. SRJS8]